LERQNIILLTKGTTIETWGSLTEVCKVHTEIKYSTIKMLKFPFVYKGIVFRKIPFKTKLIDADKK